MQCPNCGNDFMIDESSGSPKCDTCKADLIADPTTGVDESMVEVTFDEAPRNDVRRSQEAFRNHLLSSSYNGLLAEPRLSLEEMGEELRRATSGPSIVEPLVVPSEELEDVFDEERLAPLGEETVVADKPMVPKGFPLRVLLWNIADLGGGPSGTLPVRKPWTIAALAHIIRTARPDVATLLELKKMGPTLREPKPFQKTHQNTVRAKGGGTDKASTVPEKLAQGYVAFGKGDPKLLSIRLGEVLLDYLAQLFSTRVSHTIWPGATEATHPAPDWVKTRQERMEGLQPTAEASFDAEWKKCEAELARQYNPPDGTARDAAQVLSTGDLKTAAQHSTQFLLEEGYHDWCQPHVPEKGANKKKTKKTAEDNEKTEAEKEEERQAQEERAARSERARVALQGLQAVCTDLFYGFLAALAKVPQEEVAKDPKNFLQNKLMRANQHHLEALYQKKYAEYLKQKNAQVDGKELSHAGLREFLRIRDELNRQCQDRGEETYLSWPDAVPDKPRKGLYTQDEAYGVLWRKSKVTVDAEGIVYLSTYLAKQSQSSTDSALKMETDGGAKGEDGDERDAPSRFAKREPIRVPVRLAQVKGSPPVGVVAWHPPAPGPRNESARGKDFPTFLQYCQDERKAKSLGLILSDLNIDTARPKNNKAPDGSPFIDTCLPALSFHQFFGTLLGPSVDPRHLYEQAHQLSTIAKSKFNAWSVDEPRDFGSGSQQSLRSLFNKAARPEMFTSSTTKNKGLKVAPRLTSDEVLGLIESFATPPQQRYGASGYDKILVYSPSTDGWTLEQVSVFVIPFPMAIASEDEKDLFFIHGELLPEHLKPFWALIQREDAKLPDDQRLFGSLREGGVSKTGKHDARWEAVMVAAKKLSDHMPLVSNLQLVYSGRDALVLEEPALLPVASTELSKLRSLCEKYQISSASDAEAAKQLNAILEAAQKVPEAEYGQSAVLVAEAMQWRATLEVLRAEGFEDLAHWEKRPTLKHGGTQGSTSATKSLESHLAGLDSPLGLVDNKGGGDCMFRSLSQLLYGTEEHHAEIRQAVVNHLEDLLQGTVQDAGGQVGPVSTAEFREHMRLMLDWHREGWPDEPAYREVPGVDPWRHYLRAMSREGAWGDLIGLSAASHLFGVRIQLYVRTGANAFRTDLVDFVPRALGHEAAATLQLANLNQAHFVAVQPLLAMPPLAVEFPARFESLSKRRRRDEGKSPTPSSGTEPKVSAPSKTASSDPSTKGPVCLWDHRVWFDDKTPSRHPHALFLFGENDTAKKNPYYQASTQAIIRMSPNAHGVRTCWVAGIGMEDLDLAKNTAAIDEDIEDAKTKLTNDGYTALVIPWNLKANTVDIGTGVADLDKNPKSAQTWAHLKKAIDGLITWAKTNVGKVHVVPKTMGFVPSVVKHRSSDLYVQEVSRAMDDAWSVDANSSTSLKSADNVVGLRTLWYPGATSPETGLMTDAEFDKNKAAIDKGLGTLRHKVESGKFQRLVLPLDSDGKPLLGTEKGLLDQHSPKTLKYLHEELDKLVKRCGEVQVEKASAMDTDDSRPSTARPDAKRKGRDDSDDEGDVAPRSTPGTQERVTKKVRGMGSPNNSQQDNGDVELGAGMMDDPNSDDVDPVSVEDDGPHKKLHVEPRRD
ncbi:hypothetical protein JGU66_13620 [Myxococcaceae bacterium JPH2]|nr:hypothetical protein [Myxococcaceae bacterium JPH2]